MLEETHEITSFKDSGGVEWTPRLSTPAILKFVTETKISIGDMVAQNITFDAAFVALWYSCEKVAKIKRINRNEFFELIPITELPNAVQAFWNALREAFPALPKDMPNLEELLGEDDASPLDRGRPETSLNSPPLQE